MPMEIQMGFEERLILQHSLSKRLKEGIGHMFSIVIYSVAMKWVPKFALVWKTGSVLAC